MSSDVAPAPEVAVVTDSAASLPPEVAGRVVTVPMTVVVDGRPAADTGGTGQRRAARQVLSRLATGTVSTSAPSPGDFVQRLEGLGRPAVVVTVAGTMSASFESALTATGYLGTPAVVVDSGTASGGQGLVVMAAAAAAAAGEPLERVATAARAAAAQVRLVAVLDGLEHLARSGRVPGMAARATRTLGIRPMFSFSGGRPSARRPVRGMPAALARMAAECCRRPADGPTTPPHRLEAAVLHAEADGAAERLRCLVTAAVPDATTYVAPFSPVMVAHTGPGVVGLAWRWAPGAPVRPGASAEVAAG